MTNQDYIIGLSLTYKNDWDGMINDLRNHIDPPASLIKLVETYKQNLSDAGYSVLDLTEPGFPEELKRSSQPPLLLYYKGDISLLSKTKIGLLNTATMIDDFTKNSIIQVTVDIKNAGAICVAGSSSVADSIVHQASAVQGNPSIMVLSDDMGKPCVVNKVDLIHTVVAAGGLVISMMPLDAHLSLQEYNEQANKALLGLCEKMCIMSTSGIKTDLYSVENTEADKIVQECNQKNIPLYCIAHPIFNNGVNYNNTLLQNNDRIKPYVKLNITHE